MYEKRNNSSYGGQEILIILILINFYNPYKTFKEEIIDEMIKFNTLNIICAGASILSVGLILLGYEYSWILLIACLFIYQVILVGGVVNVSWQFFMPITCQLPNTDKGIFLSFDDGPQEKTALVLDLLKRYEAKGNFFCIGRNLEANPLLTQLLVDEGHFVGNHSYSHIASFPFQSKKRIVEELQKTNILIERHTREPNRFFRPPFGVMNPTIAMAVKQLNMKVIGWSIRSFDTTDWEGNKALRKIKKNLKSGDIILLHDHSHQILSILEELLSFLKDHHFKTLRIDARMGTTSS